MYDKRYPRTMQEAFGPYVDHRLCAPRQPMHKADRIVLWACALGAAALGFAVAVGWVK